MLFRLLTPDIYIEEICKITPAQLTEMGIRGVICDLDNTIIPWDQEILSDEVAAWFADLKAAGLRLCLLSNSLHARVNLIAGRLDIDAVPAAVKPRKRAFLKALDKLGLTHEEVIVIGDQIFTDIYGGKRLGLKTILVKPMSSKELLWTRFMRRLERRVLSRVVDKKKSIKTKKVE